MIQIPVTNLSARRKKKPGRGKRSDSEFSSRSIRNKAKRAPRRNSFETDSDRSFRDDYVKSNKKKKLWAKGKSK